jgi:hypothetical protein
MRQPGIVKALGVFWALAGGVLAGQSAPGASPPGVRLERLWGAPLDFAANSAIDVTPDGGVAIADVSEFRVVKYSPRGTLEWTVGRKGSGPGEFQSIVDIVSFRDGLVRAVDLIARRTVVIGAGGAVLTTSPMSFAPEAVVAMVDTNAVWVSAGYSLGIAPRSLRSASGRVLVDSLIERMTADAPWEKPESKHRHRISAVLLVADHGERVLAVDPILARVNLVDVRTGRSTALYDDSRSALRRGPAPPDERINEALRSTLSSQKMSSGERAAVTGAVARSQSELPIPSLVRHAIGMDARERLWMVRRGDTNEPLRSAIEVVVRGAITGSWNAGGRVVALSVRGTVLATMSEVLDGPREGEFLLELWRIRN